MYCQNHPNHFEACEIELHFSSLAAEQAGRRDFGVLTNLRVKASLYPTIYIHSKMDHETSNFVPFGYGNSSSQSSRVPCSTSLVSSDA
jgi:hypothetical protein